MPGTRVENAEPGDAAEAESRYAGFYARVPIGLYRTAPSGRIVDANPFLATILGYPSREALLSASAADMYVDPEDRKREQRQLRQQGVVRNFRMRLRRLDGRVIWVEDNCFLITDDDGDVVCHEGSLQDITEAVEIQGRLTKLSECFLDFGSDPLTNINRLTALCGELLGADSALYSRMEGGMLYSWAQWHTPLDFNPICEPDGKLCSDVIRRESAETVVLRDLHRSPHANLDPMVKEMGIRSYVGQAVRAADGSVGSLCAFFRRDIDPSPEDLSVVRTIAAAIGIEEKRRVAEATTARQARQMAALYDTSLEIGSQRDLTLLLNAIVSRAATMVGTPMGGMHLMDADGRGMELVVNHNLPGVYVVGTRMALGEGVAGRVAQTAEPIMIPDFAAWPGKSVMHRDSPLRRLLGVPLKIGTEVLGVLVVADDRQPGAFTEDDVRLVTLFADQAAIALQNTRLYAAAQRELGDRRRAERAMRDSEDRYRRLFEDSPVSLWEEDFSALKHHVDELRSQGVVDLSAYFAANPAEVLRCAGMVDIVDVNRATLSLFGAKAKEQLLGNLARLIPTEPIGLFVQELIALASGATLFEGEAVNRTLTGAKIDVAIRMSIAPGHEADWSKVIVSVVDITQQKSAEDKLRFVSTHDVMTGLYNRAFFEEETARLERSRHYPISVLMMDVDGLKAANDLRGHAAGDSLLRRAAVVLRAAFRVEDVVARIGGDEFAVLLPQADAAAAAEALKRVKEALAAHNREVGGAPLSLSTGVATAERGTGLAAALKAADALMYRDKEARRAAGVAALRAPRSRAARTVTLRAATPSPALT